MTRYKTRSSHFSLKGLLFATLIFSFGGIAWMLDKAGLSNFNAGTYSIIVWIIPTIMVYFPYIKKEEIVSEFKLGSWKLFLAATLNAFGYLFQLKALEMSEATKVLPIVQTSTFFTVIFAALFLQEKQDLWRKTICAVIAIVGSILLINS